MSQRRGVFLGMPIYGGIGDGRTVMSWTRLFAEGLLHGLVADVSMPPILYIDQARNMIVDEALRHPQATDLLLLDADMVWPPNIIQRLLAHDKPVVTGLYFQRRHPYHPDVFELDPFGPINHWEPGLQGLRGHGAGLGCCMIQLDVFRRMLDRFGTRAFFRSEAGGEDIYFFRRLHEMGETLWLDAECECGHLPCDVIVRKELFWAARAQTDAADKKIGGP